MPAGRVRRSVGRLAAVIVLVGGLSIGGCLWLRPSPVAIPVVPEGGYGFGVGAPQSWMSDADADRELDAVARTRASWMRVLIDWHIVEPVKGQYNWHYVDHWVNGSTKRGLKVLGLIAYTPDWARAPGSYFSAPPVNPADYADFVSAVVQRYRDRVADWEIWNEPNSVLAWTSGPQGPEPAVYAEMLKASYPKIKAADRGAVVIGGVVTAVVSFFALTMDPVTFVQKMYAAGAGGSFDALSFHPYHYNLKFSAGAGVPNSPLSQADGIHQAMAANGDGGKKLWATEYGEPNSAVDEATQADYIRDFLAKWRTLPYAGPSYVYTTRDRVTGSSNPEESIGVYRSDWSPKPAQAAVKSMT